MKIDAKTFLEENKNNRDVFNSIETTLEVFVNWREEKIKKGFGKTPTETVRNFNNTFDVGSEIVYRKNITENFKKEIVSKKAFILHGIPVFSIQGDNKHYIINSAFVLIK
jgi:hypothetical protein